MSWHPARSRSMRAVVVIGAAIAGWLALVLAMFSSTLAPEDALHLRGLLAERWGLLIPASLVPTAGGLLLHRWIARRYLQPTGRIAEAVRVAVGSDVAPRIDPEGSVEIRALAEAVNALAEQRDGLRREMISQAEQASQAAHDERNRLAALVSELAQAVVVCTLDGRILLYNNQARREFRSLSSAPEVAGGAELIGIGRSIHGAIDRRVIAHALDRIGERLARSVPHPNAQFMTATRSGQFLRVTMAPVLASPGTPMDTALSGFMLLFENVTRIVEADSERRSLLLGLAEDWRASLTSIRMAAATLAEDGSTTDARQAARRDLREGLDRIDVRIDTTLQESAQAFARRWPLEDMLATEFVHSARLRIAQELDCTVDLDAVEDAVWIRVDSFSLVQCLVYLSRRLLEELAVRRVQLRLAVSEQRALIDLAWSGTAINTETAMTWELDPMRDAGPDGSLTVREVLDRLQGALWLERDRARHATWFRFALPLAPVPTPIDDSAWLHAGSRPEYYDFDLFKQTELAAALEDRPLESLTFTVFDTETTGLNPTEGDQIIQIGATRIVNGRVLRQESFEQLVDPGRRIPAATIPIHGITDAMVQDKPRLADVLPAFHTYAQHTVLVAHNAAFDMKFLQMQEKRTGCVFDQPVLDTLLLSAVLHPNQASHRLEAIAQRLDIKVLGRHTALGDALVTAEVFLRMIPLLRAAGIRTLREAREASQRSFYARLKY